MLIDEISAIYNSLDEPGEVEKSSVIEGRLLESFNKNNIVDSNVIREIFETVIVQLEKDVVGCLTLDHQPIDTLNDSIIGVQGRLIKFSFYLC